MPKTHSVIETLWLLDAGESPLMECSGEAHFLATDTFIPRDRRISVCNKIFDWSANQPLWGETYIFLRFAWKIWKNGKGCRKHVIGLENVDLYTTNSSANPNLIDWTWGNLECRIPNTDFCCFCFSWSLPHWATLTPGNSLLAPSCTKEISYFRIINKSTLAEWRIWPC